MSAYIDAFVLPILPENVKAYQQLAKKSGKVWRDHGALEYRECLGDDLHVKGTVSFTKLAKAKPGETVIVAWVVFKSRAHRDKVNAEVMKDPRMLKMMETMAMPFDPKKMAYGGFETIVSE